MVISPLGDSSVGACSLFDEDAVESALPVMGVVQADKLVLRTAAAATNETMSRHECGRRDCSPCIRTPLLGWWA